MARPRSVLACSLLVALLVGATEVHAGDLHEEILEGKYKRGDYGVMAGWYKPNGEQFEDHADYALPIGLKVRFRGLKWFRVEGEFSYYRRSSAPISAITVVSAPSFEGLHLGASIQMEPVDLGPARPYVGAGITVPSMRNTFVVAIAEVPDDIIDRFQLATWGKWDVGYHVLGGLDFPLGHRAFPFAEFRYLFGEVTLDQIRIGAFPYRPDELETPEGGPISGTFDWGGPQVMVGLKILF